MCVNGFVIRIIYLLLKTPPIIFLVDVMIGPLKEFGPIRTLRKLFITLSGQIDY